MTSANVCIVESLGFLDEEHRKEGEIISRSLRLSGKSPHYSYVRSREELEALVKEFGESDYRYLHLSCHGNLGLFFTTLDQVPAEEMVDLLGGNLNDRRLFISACLATERAFATELMEKHGCHSVLGPVNALNFDDAAVFWTSFYHLMFKENPRSMTNNIIEINVKKCAALIGEDFRFYYWKSKQVREAVIKGQEPNVTETS